MSEGTELLGDGLGRPYTSGTFQSKLDQFEEFINSVTFQDVEATPEERRQMITGMAYRGSCNNYPKYQ